MNSIYGLKVTNWLDAPQEVTLFADGYKMISFIIPASTTLTVDGKKAPSEFRWDQHPSVGPMIFKQGWYVEPSYATSILTGDGVVEVWLGGEG